MRKDLKYKKRSIVLKHSMTIKILTWILSDCILTALIIINKNIEYRKSSTQIYILLSAAFPSPRTCHTSPLPIPYRPLSQCCQRVVIRVGKSLHMCSNSRYSETLGLGLSHNFHFGGGVFRSKLWSSQI